MCLEGLPMAEFKVVPGACAGPALETSRHHGGCPDESIDGGRRDRRAFGGAARLRRQRPRGAPPSHEQRGVDAAPRRGPGSACGCGSRGGGGRGGPGDGGEREGGGRDGERRGDGRAGGGGSPCGGGRGGPGGGGERRAEAESASAAAIAAREAVGGSAREGGRGAGGRCSGRAAAPGRKLRVGRKLPQSLSTMVGRSRTASSLRTSSSR